MPLVFMLSAERAVQGDRNAISRALNNLKLWDIPQEEIDALHVEAKKICSDKSYVVQDPGRPVGQGREASRSARR